MQLNANPAVWILIRVITIAFNYKEAYPIRKESYPDVRSKAYMSQIWQICYARQLRSASECVGRRMHCRCDRRTHSDAERTCRAIRPTQFTPPDTTQTAVSCRVWRGCELGITWHQNLTHCGNIRDTRKRLDNWPILKAVMSSCQLSGQQEC